MGFGFFQSKPSSAFGPISLTPDELGDRWKDGRLHLPLIVNYNKQFFGKANAGEMHFSFGQIIAHAARTRSLAAGTIIGSGTVSNVDVTMGSSCLAEKRMLEQINEGKIVTPFMKVGDTIEICVKDERGVDLFGTINQRIVPFKK
jgi:fumarylacetoacetate (FAA) hydrolase